MMKTVIILSLAIAGLVLSSCGRKLSPLTTEQRAIFSQTLSGLADPINVAQERALAINNRESLNGFSSNNSGYIPNSLVDDFNDFCLVSFEADGDLNRVGRNANSVQIIGKIDNKGSGLCPILFNLNAKMVAQSANQAAIDLALDYKIQNDEMKKANDITFFDIKGKGSISGSETSGSAKVSSDGTLDSQRNGKVKFYLNGDASGNETSGNGKLILGMEFKDFTAELKVEIKQASGDLSPTTTFYLNNEVITEKEFFAFFDRFNVPTKVFSERGVVVDQRVIPSVLNQMPLFNVFLQ